MLATRIQRQREWSVEHVWLNRKIGLDSLGKPGNPSPRLSQVTHAQTHNWIHILAYNVYGGKVECKKLLRCHISQLFGPFVSEFSSVLMSQSLFLYFHLHNLNASPCFPWQNLSRERSSSSFIGNEQLSLNINASIASNSIRKTKDRNLCVKSCPEFLCNV